MVEVEHHLELHGCACMVQERCAEVLHILTHLLLGKHKQSTTHAYIGYNYTVEMVLRTVYSARNSDSMACRRFSSQDSWKAVSTGSLELRAISELAESALYALILDWEWRRESVV